MVLFSVGMGAGLLNGLLGAGGGILIVALFSHLGLETKEAHATAIAVMLPLTLISLFIYALNGNLPFKQAFVFLLPALAGSALGAMLLKKVNPAYLKLAFSLLILYSSLRPIFHQIRLI